MLQGTIRMIHRVLRKHQRVRNTSLSGGIPPNNLDTPSGVDEIISKHERDLWEYRRALDAKISIRSQGRDGQ